MLKEERQKKILEILAVEQKVIASDLSQRLSVSEDTIRRDLRELDTQHLLKRVHSGAINVGPPVTDFSYRQNLNTDKKKNLASKALPFLKENSVIIIDGSTTNLSLVQSIPTDFKATIITNSPPIAMELANFKNIDVINIGGQFYKQSMINVGVQTYKELEHLRADLYIMGIYNVDLENGTSVPTVPEAEIKRQMCKISSEVLGMITNDKFETVSNAIVGPVEDLSVLISENIPSKIKRAYNQKNIILID